MELYQFLQSRNVLLNEFSSHVIGGLGKKYAVVHIKVINKLFSIYFRCVI